YLAAGDMHVLMYSPQADVTTEQAIVAAYGEDGPYPTGHRFGRFVTYIVVHKDNPIAGLSTAQLQDVLSGKITNWREVGGYAGQIVVYGESRTSKSHEMLTNTVMT